MLTSSYNETYGEYNINISFDKEDIEDVFEELGCEDYTDEDIENVVNEFTRELEVDTLLNYGSVVTNIREIVKSFI